MTGRPRLASIWLDGCSGCHMSLLDLDEALLELTARAEVVYGPLVDAKRFPDDVDVTLVEGAVSTDEDLRRLREARSRSRVLVALGDCAVTANVPGLRNPYGPGPLLDCAYRQHADEGSELPGASLPRLLARSSPLHAVVHVDVYLPGCPPPAAAIGEAIEALLRGEQPPGKGRFG